MSLDEKISSLIEKSEGSIRASLLIKDWDTHGTISFSYLAMYNAIHALLLTKGHTYKNGRPLKAAFNLYFLKDNIIKSLSGKRFNELTEIRHKIDFDLHFKLTNELSQNIQNEAIVLTNEIKSYLSKHNFINE